MGRAVAAARLYQEALNLLRLPTESGSALGWKMAVLLEGEVEAQHDEKSIHLLEVTLV